MLINAGVGHRRRHRGFLWAPLPGLLHGLYEGIIGCAPRLWTRGLDSIDGYFPFYFTFYLLLANGENKQASHLLRASSLSDSVATVDDNVSTGGVGAGIADEVDVSALELLGVAVAAEGNHAPPQLLGLRVDEVGQTGVDVSGGNGVDTGKVAPLVGEGLGQVDAAGLGDVVGGLLLGVVGDVAGHGGSDDERAVALLLEVGADGLCAVGGAAQVDLDNVVPFLGGAVDDTAVGSSTGARESKPLAVYCRQPWKRQTKGQ